MKDAIPDSEAAFDGGVETPRPAFVAAPSQEELFARLRLSRSHRVGPATFRRLIAEHGDAVAALAAVPEMARAAGDARYEVASEATIRAEIRAARKHGARLLTLGAPGYPERLAQIGDAPGVLWAQGDTDLLARPCVAIVGTRNASSLALRMARALGRALTEAGVTVVSGLARGVDAAAHEAALPGGTVAVHAGGLDRVYPPENVELGARIAAQGLSLSERAFGHGPQARDFPRRNRIVSGVSQVVVVVEAAVRSGSMITARDAADQGREVMAVPGHPFDGRAAGCNLLLRDGAGLVRGVDDILEVLAGGTDGPTRLPRATFRATRPDVPPDLSTSPAPQDASLQDRILGLLSPVPVATDQLLRDLSAAGAVAPDRLVMLLSEMELSGLVARRAGGALVRL